MNKRLSEIIEYKTGGKQTAFAELMGWSPQYLSKLLRGDSIGLAPVISVISKLPEINARWFLLGEGDMLTDTKLSEVRATAQSRINSIMELERYLPVMSPAEVSDFERMCIGEITPSFSPETIEGWKLRLARRQEEINNRFKEALCRQPKANK